MIFSSFDINMSSSYRIGILMGNAVISFGISINQTSAYRLDVAGIPCKTKTWPRTSGDEEENARLDLGRRVSN